MSGKNKLIVALDVDSQDKCLEVIDILSPEVDIFKVGIAPFTDFGHAILDKLKEKGKKVFLDLKFHDIPNTVRNAVCVAARKDVFMMNVHCLGGKSMLEQAVKGAGQGASGKGRPLLLGVTILTSMDEEGIREIGLAGTVGDRVTGFAEMAKDAGLDGVVASAKETGMIKEKLGKDFIVVTPGIRPEWSSAGDQKRIVTPRQAIENGSDYIVVGRPVIQDKDPLAAAKKIIEEIGG